jgi:ankyrin repeat protein
MALSAGGAAAGPLHDAASSGDEALVIRLLEGGADINEQNATGETALILAALGGHTKVVDELLMRNADATLRNDRGMTALHAAAFFGEPEEVSLLTGDAKFSSRLDLDDAENKFGVTPLIVAAEENHANVVAHLATLGADLEKTERHGYTALTRAAYHGHDEVVTILLRLGAVCQEIDPGWHEECLKRKAALGL